jgi:hypothetical protein
MNLKVIQWLLKHRDALIRVAEIAKKFDRSAPYLTQWAVVSEIAQIVLPILEAEAVRPKLFGWDGLDGEVLDTPQAYDARVFSVGAEVSALGLDWRTIIDVLLPILIAILQAVGDKE